MQILIFVTLLHHFDASRSVSYNRSLSQQAEAVIWVPGVLRGCISTPLAGLRWNADGLGVGFVAMAANWASGKVCQSYVQLEIHRPDHIIHLDLFVCTLGWNYFRGKAGQILCDHPPEIWQIVTSSQVGTFGFNCLMGACDFIVSPHHSVWLQIYFMYTGYMVSLLLMVFSYAKVLILLRQKRRLNERQAS